MEVREYLDMLLDLNTFIFRLVSGFRGDESYKFGALWLLKNFYKYHGEVLQK